MSLSVPFPFMPSTLERNTLFQNWIWSLSHFAAGAMENYGLVMYREATLLFDNFFLVAINKQRVAVVVAHELAHQWFGNLVTMEWWKHLWLNDGFATWVRHSFRIPLRLDLVSDLLILRCLSIFLGFLLYLVKSPTSSMNTSFIPFPLLIVR